MSKENLLALTYLEHAPHAAARDLQGLPITEAAEFLESVPARLSAPVVNEMIPWSAARCIEHLTHPRAAAILRQMSFHESASLLRLIRQDTHEPIFNEMSTSLAKRLRGALSYPLSQVGAWTDPSVPVLKTSDTVQTALDFLRESGPASHIFVESDDKGTYCGGIAIASILRSNRSSRLSQLSIDAVEPISNRASLATMAFDSRWDEFLFLPVVGRRRSVLGGLSRSALRKGTNEHFADINSASKPLIGHLLVALAVAGTGLFKLLIHSRDDLSSGNLR